MADLSDVENALKSLIVSAIYPTGIGELSAITLCDNAVECKVARGWPLKTTLQTDLQKGIANVSVFPQPGSERNTTRFPKDWQVLTPAAPTLTMAAAGNTLTLGGTISTPQNIAIVVDGATHLYAVQSVDTLATIASALASEVPGATSSGPTITLPNDVGLLTAVGGAGVQWREIARQERLFDIGIWCNSPEQRDAVASFLDAYLKGFDFITLPDGTSARMLYNRSTVSDHEMLDGLFRRDLIFLVEYPTVQTAPAFQIVAVEANLTGGQTRFDPHLPTLTLNI